jgi:hypothetical protein
MKTTKTLEVRLCDFCSDEGARWVCSQCKKDVCAKHAGLYRVGIKALRPPDQDSLIFSAATVEMVGVSTFDFDAVVCHECADTVEDVLRSLNLRQARITPTRWKDAA